MSLRSACDISRACRPTCVSPMSPSSSAFVTSAATESTTTTSTALRADQHLGDVERLFAGVRLRDEQVVEIDAERLRRSSGSSACSTSMNAAVPPSLLRFGDDVQRERRLTARFRAVDLDDAAAREARRRRARDRGRSIRTG